MYVMHCFHIKLTGIPLLLVVSAAELNRFKLLEVPELHQLDSCWAAVKSTCAQHLHIFSADSNQRNLNKNYYYVVICAVHLV